MGMKVLVVILANSLAATGPPEAPLSDLGSP
jgi:hypothetical protein